MTPSEFANKIRTKYPGQYDDLSDNDLTSKVLSKHPQYSDMIDASKPSQPTPTANPLPWEMEKMQGTPKSPSDLVGQFGSQMLEGLTSPMPGSLLSVPVKAMSQTAQQAGTETTKAMINENSPATVAPARAAGMAVSTLLDPISYIGGELSKGMPKSEIEGAAKGFVSTIGDKIKGIFTKPAPQEEIESSINDLQQNLITHRQTVGAELGKLRGTQQSAGDLLHQIAEKGPEVSATPQEAAQKVDQYLSTLPKSKAPVMGDMVPGATTKDIAASAPELEKAPYTPGSKPVQKGDVVTLKSSDPNLPDVDAMHNGPHTVAPNISYQLKEPIPETDPTRIAERLESSKRAQELFPGLPAEDPNNIVKHPAGSDVASSALQDYGYQIPDKIPYSSAKEELADVIKMKGSLQDQLSKRTLDQAGNQVKAVSPNEERAYTYAINQLNNRMEQIPGGSAIRAKEAQFAKVAGVYDDVQSKLSEPGKADQFLRGLYKNPTGKNADYIDKLRLADKMTGSNTLQSLFEKYATQDKGLNYETLKHPIASTLRSAIPAIGDTLQNLPSRITPPIATALKGNEFPLSDAAQSELQSFRDRLKNAQ